MMARMIKVARMAKVAQPNSKTNPFGITIPVGLKIYGKKCGLSIQGMTICPNWCLFSILLVGSL